jgi:hypothetical protein
MMAFAFGADPVGLGKVAGTPRRPARLDRLLDLVDRNRRLFVFRAAQRHDAEHAVEPLEGPPHRRRVLRAELAGVDRRVQRAHEIEHGAQSGGGVEIGNDDVVELLLRLRQPGRDRGMRR